MAIRTTTDFEGQRTAITQQDRCMQHPRTGRLHANPPEAA